MSTTTRNEIRKIIEECEATTEVSPKAAEKVAVKPTPNTTKGKIHKAKTKPRHWVCVDLSDPFSGKMSVVYWDKAYGIETLKKLEMPRPAHFTAALKEKFYTNDFAEFMRCVDLGLAPSIREDGQVILGRLVMGTTEEKLLDFPSTSPTPLCVITDFSVAKACSDDMVKPSLTYAFFCTMNKTLTLFASDSHRLHYTTSGFTFEDGDISPEEFMKAMNGAFVPRAVLEAKGEIKLGIDNSHYVVSYDNVTLRYPITAIQTLSEATLKSVTRIDKGAAFEMGLAVPSLKIVAKDKTPSHKVEVEVTKPGEAQLNLTNPEVFAAARVPVVSKPVIAVSFGVNAEYLLDAIDFAGDSILYQNVERPDTSQMVVSSTTGDRVAVIMPIVIKPADTTTGA